MKNVLLLLLSTLLGLIALETALQLALKPSQIFRGVEYVPELNQWRNEIQFWEQYQHATEGDFANYDQLLGWDFHNGGRRYQGDADIAEQRQPGVTRIVAVGDSFVWGNEVSAAENFCAQLAGKLPGTETLNMGVPGYGIDQAWLKYRHFGAAHTPDVVIFGVYVDDYVRSSMSFTSFSKPHFKRDGAEVRLTNQPVPAPLSELERIDTALDEQRFRLVALLGNAWHRLQAGEPEQQAYLAYMDDVIEHIFTELRTALSPEQRVVILHIPKAEAFVDPDPFDAQVEAHLRTLYAKLDLPVIDLGQRFLDTADPQTVFDQYYVHRPNGSVGHLSALGHRRTADLLAHWLSKGI